MRCAVRWNAFPRRILEGFHMFRETIVGLTIATAASLGAMSLYSAPASAYDGGGYCYYHPHDPVCLAGVVAPYVAHHAYHEHYDDHYDDHYDHHHHEHDHDHHHHDHDHDHDHHHHH